MRTLIAVTVTNPETCQEVVRNWLSQCGFHPEAVELGDQCRDTLLNDEKAELPQVARLSNASEHAFDILAAIPLLERERRHAVNTATWSIHVDDPHGNTVWGLVCVDSPTLTVRWRHRYPRSLEYGTETFVSEVIKSGGPGKVFVPLRAETIIPVREPQNTSDAYAGHIHPPSVTEIQTRARIERGTEWNIARIMLMATLLFFVAGYLLFRDSTCDDLVRWLSGACDRLATTAAASAAVAYLSYYFHLKELRRKPIIEWK